MVCQACGSVVGPEVRFCPKCGAQVAAVAPPSQPAAGYPPYPPMVAAPRVQRHLQTLGTLWCIFGVYRILAGLAALFFVRTMAWRYFGGGGWTVGRWGGMHGPPWMVMMPVLMMVLLVTSVLAFLAGYSLLTRRPWGRTLAIIAAILALLKFPLGTALGTYTLWVLAPGVSGMEYDAIADRS
ncbi:zinc ribbon domain-containing protein [Edaphobacter bradus]|uniref:zinc ribbon domain-containing protein n=1 Tax=Edaphobacter bradus TaxID=2259016 RepID=UPI0021E0BF55|nr:zinc ribbon domain-containing protein [Edaphobacter bradus]